jgi:hypothetical protein
VDRGGEDGEEDAGADVAAEGAAGDPVADGRVDEGAGATDGPAEGFDGEGGEAGLGLLGAEEPCDPGGVLEEAHPGVARSRRRSIGGVGGRAAIQAGYEIDGGGEDRGEVVEVAEEGGGRDPHLGGDRGGGDRGEAPLAQEPEGGGGDLGASFNPGASGAGGHPRIVSDHSLTSSGGRRPAPGAPSITGRDQSRRRRGPAVTSRRRAK